MSDCDQSEKNVLLMVWPGLYLVAFLSHLYQAWRRGYTRILGADSTWEVKATRNIIKKDLRTLQRKLVTELLIRKDMSTKIDLPHQFPFPECVI